MEIDITDIVKREYRIVDAKLIGNMIQVTVDGRDNLYIMRDGKLYKYQEVSIDSSLHVAKFERIYQTVKRDRNIETLTDDL